jgi:hypothetical protein
MGQDNNKVTLYVDVDDTILKSSEAVIKILNKKYDINPSKSINDMKDWGYRSIYKNITDNEVEKIYESDEFFNMVEFDQSFLNFYKTNKNKIDIVICTKGTKINIEKKENLIKKVLGENITYIGIQFKLDNDGNKIKDYRKSIINMKHGIQIDDRTDALRDTNANIKILINNDILRTWNQNYENINNLYVARNWDEIEQIVLFAYDNHFIFKKS